MITPGLVLIQLLNGLQFGITLFLFTAGLTLVLGIMNFMNLAHASLYMIGAYYAVALGDWTGSFVLGVLLALPATYLTAMAVEWLVFKNLYRRHHLDQVLVTFGLIMIANEAVRMVWGTAGLYVTVPPFLSGTTAPAPARSIRSVASSSSSPATPSRSASTSSSAPTRASACGTRRRRQTRDGQAVGTTSAAPSRRTSVRRWRRSPAR